jgi:hypothetical protein
MTTAAFKYFGDERRRFLKRLFRAWHQQLCDFEDWMDDDLPYWYGERTNTGVLTAAALRLKNTTIALEEYAVQKATGGGRADLYLYDSAGNCSYDFEFKQCWTGMRGSSQKTIVAALQEARVDVKKLPKPTYSCLGLAATFVVPYRERIPPPEKQNEYWNKFVQHIAEPAHFGADFVAVHRASDESMRRALQANGSGIAFCPGIAVVGRIVRRHT